MNIVCIIPARGGSKGVTRKNIRKIAGKPLLQYSIEHAKQTPMITDVIVSTDDEEIKLLAESVGAKVITRPAALSGDTATSESALLHGLREIEKAQSVDYVVFLQCTSPIREADDITKAINLLISQQADSLLSVVEDHSFLWREDSGSAIALNYDYQARPRRQDMALQYRENGSIYIVKPEILKRTNNRLGGKIALYPMNEDSAVDIDTEYDLSVAESILMRK